MTLVSRLRSTLEEGVPRAAALARRVRGTQVSVPEPEPEPAPAPPAPSHRRAEEVYLRTLRDHPQLSDRESRLCELIEYYGWEIGHRAQFATPWFYEDDPRMVRYAEAMGVETNQLQILHMYSLFNRMDPERPDLFWIFDDLVDRLERLGGPEQVSVLDFGTGLGQIGLSFCTQGYRTVMSDRVTDFLDFIRFRAENHRLAPVLNEAETDYSFYDTGADGHRYGLVIEWSAFEHVHDVIPALETITRGLVPGGIFLTTTFKKDWTPELIEHYRRDSQDDDIADQYFSPEVDRWIDERFEVVNPERSLAKLLIRKG